MFRDVEKVLASASILSGCLKLLQLAPIRACLRRVVMVNSEELTLLEKETIEMKCMHREKLRAKKK